MTKKQSNPTKRLSQTRTYVIAGEKYDYTAICNKVVTELKNKELSPKEIIDWVGMYSPVSCIHLLPTMLADGLIDYRRKYSSDILVYTSKKSNRLQDLLYPRDKFLAGLKLTGHRKVYHLGMTIHKKIK